MSNLFRSSPLFDSIEIVKSAHLIEAHPHVCHICDEQFPCVEENCKIQDKYAVCNKPACGEQWEAEETEPHSHLCICEDHS